LGYGWEINIFGIGGKLKVNGPNANLFSFENGKLSYDNGFRWFNIQVGHAAANVSLNNINGKFNSKIHLGQMAISTDEGLRYSPLTIGFHFGIIGFSYESSRSYQNAGFEYYNARQHFFETTGFPMPWR
jgi:hypothetical protein